MKKPIVKAKLRRALGQIRRINPYAGALAVGGSAALGLMAMHKRKKKREKEGKLIVNNKLFKF